MVGRSSLSIVLAIGERREMGRYEVLTVESLPGLGMGRVTEFFHI